jgi:hypothetical protein
LFTEDGKLTQQDFLQLWKEAEATNTPAAINGLKFNSIDALRQRFALNNIFTVAERQMDNKYTLYQSVKLADSTVLMIEVQAPFGVQGLTDVSLSARSQNEGLIGCFIEALEMVLRHKQ